MGYTTYFEGEMTISPALSPEQVAYIQKFNQTRRMKRDSEKAKTVADPLREAVGLPVGENGEFFVEAEGSFGQKSDFTVINSNNPPKTQPGLWCQWTVSDDGTTFQWDEGEKFYYYVEWLQYMSKNFFDKWGVKLTGEIKWTGEDSEDFGKIVIEDHGDEEVDIQVWNGVQGYELN